MTAWKLEPMQMCRLAIASNLGSILLHLAVVREELRFARLLG